jgi:drug/metabolite transporter (DMT)-like permease
MERWLAQGSGARVCAVLGAITIAWSSILVKLSAASPSTAAIFRCAYALPVLAVLAFLEDRRYGARAWRDRRAAIAGGFFMAPDLILWHHSIEEVGAGLATVLANIQVVGVPLVAWVLLRERPSRRLLIALPITCVGVLLISGVVGHGGYGRNPAAGAAYGIGAGLAYVGVLLFLRRGAVDLRRPAGPLLDLTFTAAVTSAVIGAIWGDAHFVPVWPGAGWLALLAVTSQVMGWLLISISLPRLPAALTSLLLMIQPVGSLALGAIIFGESPSSVQLVGVVLVMGAVVYATRSDSARGGAEPLSGRGPALVAGSARWRRVRLPR